VVADGMRRRRLCTGCKRRFTTYEKAGAASIKVQKRDGTVQPFDSEKLLLSLQRVGRRRPTVRTEDAKRIARDIEANLVDSGRKTVHWSDIVKAALERLQAIDSVAAARLRANYVDEFGEVRYGDQEAETPMPQLALPGVDVEDE
jgi:transcriptional repressor NrdR